MATSTQYPSLVMIIRHGEKPGKSGSEKDGGPHLSERGSARAAALPTLFTPDPTATTPVTGMRQLCCDVTAGSTGQFVGAYSSSGIAAGQSRFQTPDFLFATKQDPPETGSNRPVETITPLAQALKMTIHHHYADKQYDDLAKKSWASRGRTAAK